MRNMLLCFAGLFAASCSAGAIDWATIGSPGNRPANADESPMFYEPIWPYGPIGRVDHTYRLSRTEVTVGEYLEFVEAYAPYWTLTPGDSRLVGNWIVWNASSGYSILPGAENYPADMSWESAARFCNWLHNDKGSNQSAFEQGAYDASTFARNPDNTMQHQTTPSSGARFWLPTLDEWVKGMYYDPHKHGPGQEGYWLYPNSSDTPLIPGYPEDGGETTVGLPPFGPIPDVGSYPDVQSPWGLLDGSGGQSEWLSLISTDYKRVGLKGSPNFFPMGEYYDRIDVLFFTQPLLGASGIRLASSVPSPAAVLPLALIMLAQSRRRRSAVAVATSP
jgi:hypothetical protein